MKFVKTQMQILLQKVKYWKAKNPSEEALRQEMIETIKCWIKAIERMINEKEHTEKLAENIAVQVYKGVVK